MNRCVIFRGTQAPVGSIKLNYPEEVENNCL